MVYEMYGSFVDLENDKIAGLSRFRMTHMDHLALGQRHDETLPFPVGIIDRCLLQNPDALGRFVSRDDFSVPSSVGIFADFDVMIVLRIVDAMPALVGIIDATAGCVIAELAAGYRVQ